MDTRTELPLKILSAPGFLELLAINVMNLYRILMVSRDESIPLVKRIRKEIQSPQPGDIVLQLNGPDRSHMGRIGLLEQIIPKKRAGDLYVIQNLEGDYKVVRGGHFIKVPREIIGVQ